MQSIDYKIKNRVYGSGRGSVFSPNDYLSLGSRHPVDKLSRLASKSPFTELTPQGPDGLFISAQVDELAAVLDRVRATAMAT